MTYKSGTTPHDTAFVVGQMFNNAIDFWKALVNYCVNLGIDIKYKKNHKDKVGANCKMSGCPWRIWASWAGKSKTFQVKTYNGEHKCGRGNVVKKISSSWIVEYYKNKFKINPYIKLQEIIDTVWSEWGSKVSNYMVGQARKKAQLSVVGEYREQYLLLHRYAAEILKTYSDNTVKFSLDNGVFQRVYICFSSLKLGFLAGCRPFISLDGCFLKGPFGGQLLVAVGRDGNNQMFSIAWAVVKLENT
ncbi:uncharacterized protein LOC141618282 [Silene latifolia]|uniref:uncharacterized protein LOC141618282 n=1 Tax=Silene latifolia TaxID=37657 RepID=UPI003D775714